MRQGRGEPGTRPVEVGLDGQVGEVGEQGEPRVAPFRFQPGGADGDVYAYMGSFRGENVPKGSGYTFVGCGVERVPSP